MSYMLIGIIYYDYNCSVIFVAFACRLTILAQMLCLQLCFRTKISLVLVHYLVRQRIRCKPTNLCKLGNYQSGPLDADPMDGVRGLKRKKKRPTGGGA